VREIGRILKPGGAWCLIWNLEDRNVGWVAGLRDAYEQFESGSSPALSPRSGARAIERG